jgi:VCBS repeat-containing protein
LFQFFSNNVFKRILTTSLLALTLFACGGGGSDSNAAPAVNHAPTIGALSYSVDEDAQLQEVITATDQDGDSLSYSLMSDVSNGTLVFSNDGSFEYQPADNYYGEDSFTASASDGSLSSDTVTFTIQVKGINDVPTLSTVSYSVDEDVQLQEAITANDQDGDSLSYSLMSDVSNGILVFSNDGSFEYQPADNYYGEDSFTASASDGSLSSETVTFTIQVKGINDVPTLSSASYSVDEDSPLEETVTATDQDGDSLTYGLMSDVSNGTLVFSNDGSFEYQPTDNYYGEDSFNASASDGSLSSETVTFIIQVNAINDAPSIQATSKSTRLDESIIFSLNGEDIDNEDLTYSVIVQPEKGVAVLNDNNTITYTPTLGSAGLDELKVQVSDGELTAAAVVTIDNNLAFKGNIVADSLDGVEVLLTGDGYLLKSEPDSSGSFKFYGIPDGDYAVKVRKDGYKSSTAIAFSLDISEVNQPQTNVVGFNKIQQTKSAKSSVSSATDDNDFELVALDSNNFSFHWEEDQSTAGYDYSAHINEPLTIEFLDEQLTIVDDSSANQLQHDLNILLVDSGDAKWTQEHAYRIAELMKTIPQAQRDPYKAQSLTPSKWQLTSDFIEDDIQITITGEHKTILISDAVFVNAAPRMAKIEGKRGLFYSQRLHHALIRFVTNNGTDEAAYEKILTERYGVSTLIPDYSVLTYPTGNEGEGRFQSFHSNEIVQIINMFEEMPKGMHKLPELNYLVRRLDGTPHPLYADAPAVAWSEAGYIEFMESAFNTSNVEHMHRLVIHEKSHFLWANQFDVQLKDDWIELGGWYEDASTDSGWATSKQTEFVSAYAHSKNPNEDIAESISYFIINPDLLKSRAIGKYEFVRDRIMQGNIYISQVNENLTFQVYNLFPDYVFPGKIKRVDIRVDGMPEEDKIVTIEIELHALDVELEGAKVAFLRALSEIGTFTDVYLNPVNANGERLGDGELSTTLQGSFTLSKYAKAGFWRTQQITITDSVGNQRMEGANDFGWKLYVNNPLEDTVKPEYVENTASLTKSIAEREGLEVQIIHATWQVNENNLMRENSPCYASMNDEILSTYRVEEYGNYDDASEICSVDFIMPHYMPSSNYSMHYISMYDLALNQRGTYFTNSGGGLRDEDINLDELPQQIELVTNNQDIEQPELNLNDIQIVAVPTNTDAPNGETIVTVTFKVRDNNSGYNIASLSLRDPQGINHQFWAYNDDTWTLFPTDDATQWHTYTRNIVLPVGSAPGTWGMSEMTIYDRAGNFKGYDFTEIVHFDVVE